MCVFLVIVCDVVWCVMMLVIFSLVVEDDCVLDKYYFNTSRLEAMLDLPVGSPWAASEFPEGSLWYDKIQERICSISEYSSCAFGKRKKILRSLMNILLSTLKSTVCVLVIWKPR